MNSPITSLIFLSLLFGIFLASLLSPPRQSTKSIFCAFPKENGFTKFWGFGPLSPVFSKNNLQKKARFTRFSGVGSGGPELSVRISISPFSGSGSAASQP